MKHGYLFILTLLSGALMLRAQPEAYFVHYGAEDGLPQHTITDILQDRNGFMWFSTWDGLSKFDGYTFTTYHLPSSNTVESNSSRIDHLYEDKYNNIWTLSYDNQAYRFDVQTESFLGTSTIEDFKEHSFSASQIIPMKSGRVWLLSEEEGCISINDSLYNTTLFNTLKHNLTDNGVNSIYEDNALNTWILTNGGLTLIPSGGSGSLFFFIPYPKVILKKKFHFLPSLNRVMSYGLAQTMVLCGNMIKTTERSHSLPLKSVPILLRSGRYLRKKW